MSRLIRYLRGSVRFRLTGAAQVQRQRQAAVCAVGIAHNDLMLHGFLLYTFFCPGRPFFALCSAVS